MTADENIPKKQRALVFDKYNGPLEVREIPVPELADDEVLVNLKYSGICNTDWHVYIGGQKNMSASPLVGGHEGAGIVVKIGKDVTGWAVGDKAGVKPMNLNCLCCEMCKTGNDPLCPHIENYGLERNGTFQEYVALRGIDAVKIGKDTDLALAVPVLCAGWTVFKSLRDSQVKPGQILAINGAAGGLGSYGIQYAKAMGMRVLAIDRGDKEEHCKKMGAEWFVDGFKTPDLEKHIMEITDGGPHGVISLAVDNKPIEQAVDYVRKNGTVVIVALPLETECKFDVSTFILKAINLKGSLMGSRADVDEAMAFVDRGVVKVPLDIVKLEDVPKIYQKMADGDITSRAVVDFSL